eukprot:5906206-Heterocapsa_arctica.AAC.1
MRSSDSDPNSDDDGDEAHDHPACSALEASQAEVVAPGAIEDPLPPQPLPPPAADDPLPPQPLPPPAADDQAVAIAEVAW